MDYRTLLLRPGEYTEVTKLVIARGDYSTNTYNATLQHSKSAASVDGAVELVNPVSENFVVRADFDKLKARYFLLDGEVYFFPSTSTISQFSTPSTKSLRVECSVAHKITTPEIRLFSGLDEDNNIISKKIVADSNGGEHITLGAVRGSTMTVKIRSKENSLSVPAGTEFVVYSVDQRSNQTQIGVYTCEKPEWVSDRIYKIVLHDNVQKLSKDITSWFRNLSGWPYALTTFFGMLCDECGVGHTYSTWNGAGSFYVHKFDIDDGTTGRTLMRWICEAMGNYCIADAQGRLASRWYHTLDSLLLFGTKAEADQNGGNHYYQDSLSYGDYRAKDVNYIQLRTDETPSAQLWPGYASEPEDKKKNMYVITGNRILLSHPTYGDETSSQKVLYNALKSIASRFDMNGYTPFKATIPENPAVRVGQYAKIKVGDKQIMCPVTDMTVQNGKMILSCSVKRTRETADSPSDWTGAQHKQYVDSVVPTLAALTPGLNLTGGKISTDKDFRHSGHTVEHYGTDCWYYSASDNDEKSLEAWMDGHLSEMPAYSSRTLVFGCYPAVSGPRICGTLYRDETTNNAVFYGASYGGNGTIFVKAKLTGTWAAMKKLALS